MLDLGTGEWLVEHAHRRSLEEQYPNLIKVLEYVVKEEGKKSILDRLARAISEDMIAQTLYEAVRVAHCKVTDVDENFARELEMFQERVRNNPHLAARLASYVLAKVHEKKACEQKSKTQVEKEQESETKEKSVQTSQAGSAG